MKPTYQLILIIAVSGLIAPQVRGQAVLDKTTLGESQNDYRDLQNSLIPGPKKYGKGEKKEEVDLRTLQTKSIKDTTFQGNLMDLDLEWRGEKLGKPGSSGDKDSKAPKKIDGTGEKDAKASQPADSARDKEKASKSGEAPAGSQNKDQKTTAPQPDEKPPEKDKASASKTDDNR